LTKKLGQTTKGSNRVIRGGSWNNDPQNCRSANRNNNAPGNRNNNIGLRLANTACCRKPEFYGNPVRAAVSVQSFVRHPDLCTGIEYTFARRDW